MRQLGCRTPKGTFWGWDAFLLIRLNVEEIFVMKEERLIGPVGNSLPWSRVGRTLVAAGLLTGVSGLVGAGGARAEEVTKTFTVSGHARVKVETDDGAVRVTTGDIKQVEIRVVYSGYKLDRDLRVSTEQNGDSVDVSAKTSGGGFWSWGVRHSSLRVEVHMPKDADLSIRSGDGSVEADSINGNVDVTTGDGSISVQGVKGNMRFHSGDGHIQAHGLDGTVDASAGDGSINLEGRFDGLSIRTGDGSVTARASEGSKLASGWTIHTGDGSVDLEVPGDLQANLDASTHDGHISMGLEVTVEGTFSSSSIHGKLNGGGQTLSIHTGDGSIHLSKT
jgi:Putative adhesin